MRANLERLSDIKDWWDIAKGDVTSVIEDAEFIAQAAALLPPAPWDEGTWGAWTSAVKEKTGRKGRGLFMPLRQALTGMEHGPELPVMLQLIGPDIAKARLAVTFDE